MDTVGGIPNHHPVEQLFLVDLRVWKTSNPFVEDSWKFPLIPYIPLIGTRWKWWRLVQNLRGTNGQWQVQSCWDPHESGPWVPTQSFTCLDGSSFRKLPTSDYQWMCSSWITSREWFLNQWIPMVGGLPPTDCSLALWQFSKLSRFRNTWAPLLEPWPWRNVVSWTQGIPMNKWWIWNQSVKRRRLPYRLNYYQSLSIAINHYKSLS